MHDERKRRWEAHCHRMAEMTYAIADWCDDPEMMSTYLALGARWIQLAANDPAAAQASGATDIAA